MKFDIKTEIHGHLVSTVKLDEQFSNYPYETMVFDRRVDRNSWHSVSCKRSANEARALTEHKRGIDFVVKRIHDEHLDEAERFFNVQ